MSLYDDLGIGKDATPDEIKAAHRRRAKETHPDKPENKGKRDEFDRVSTAALILRDPARREKYDRDGTIDNDASIDIELQGAIHLAHEVFQQGIMQCKDLGSVDLIGRGIMILESSIGDIENLIADSDRKAERYRKAIKRLRHKGSGPNFLLRILEDHITDCRKDVERLRQNLAGHKRAIELLRDYEWQQDERRTDGWPGSAVEQALLDAARRGRP